MLLLFCPLLSAPLEHVRLSLRAHFQCFSKVCTGHCPCIDLFENIIPVHTGIRPNKNKKTRDCHVAKLVSTSLAPRNDASSNVQQATSTVIAMNGAQLNEEVISIKLLVNSWKVDGLRYSV